MKINKDRVNFVTGGFGKPGQKCLSPQRRNRQANFYWALWSEVVCEKDSTSGLLHSCNVAVISVLNAIKGGVKIENVFRSCVVLGQV